MLDAIIDNSTLTSVQRLFGDIEIKNKNTIDGDILALESLIQTILFNDNIFYLDDYKEEFKEKRKEYFSEFKDLSLSKDNYDEIIQHTQDLFQKISLTIKGGLVEDENFKPFFELLKMHNIFTWDMKSSVYYLTQKLLQGNDKIDIDKYSKLNEMIFSEMQDNRFKDECGEKKPLLFDSKGNPISSGYHVVDKGNNKQEVFISPQTKLWFANLNWLAFRSIFYTLVAKELGCCSLVLNPIRNSFQINFIAKYQTKPFEYRNDIIEALNLPANETLKSIFEMTEPLVVKEPLPMFSAYLANTTQNPLNIIEEAYSLRNKDAFVQARQQLDDLDNLILNGENKKYLEKANSLRLSIKKQMQSICGAYNVTTPQGISVSPLITVYNTSTLVNQLPKIPNIKAKIGNLDKILGSFPQKGFKAVYRSLINDLTSISQLGDYHTILTSQIKVDSEETHYNMRIEDEKYLHSKSSWKIPM